MGKTSRVIPFYRDFIVFVGVLTGDKGDRSSPMAFVLVQNINTDGGIFFLVNLYSSILYE